jgi:hypothetical protein
MGYCVPPLETIAAKIREKIPETLSLGVGGAGPYTRYVAFREYATKLRPKVVIWLETDQTLRRMALPVEQMLKHKYANLSFSQRLMDRQEEIDTKVKQFIAAHTFAKLDTRPFWYRKLLLSGIREKIMKPFHDTSDVAAEEKALDDLIYGDSYDPITMKYKPTVLIEYAKILQAVKSSTEKWGGTLIYFYLPSQHVDGKLKSDKEELFPVVKKLEIPIIDMAEVFDRETDTKKYYPRSDGVYHFGPKGYALAADLILKSLQENCSQLLMQPKREQSEK